MNGHIVMVLQVLSITTHKMGVMTKALEVTICHYSVPLSIATRLYVFAGINDNLITVPVSSRLSRSIFQL